MPQLRHRWAIFRFVGGEPRLELGYRDSLGRKRRLVWGHPLGPPPHVILNKLSDLLARLIRDLPGGRPGPHDTGPVPAALYVSSPKGVDRWDFESRFESVAAKIADPDRIQVVRLRRGRARARTPFSLPFEVLAKTDAVDALAELEKSSWYENAPAVREGGLRVETTDDVPRSLASHPRDILLLRRPEADRLRQAAPEELRAIARLRPANRPRLIVLLDSNEPRNWPRDPIDSEASEWKIPPGTALLHLPHPRLRPGVERFLKSFFYGLIHDLPLHEACKAAGRTDPLDYPVRLTADPAGNESLRMLDALIDLRRQSARVEIGLPVLSDVVGRPVLMLQPSDEAVDLFAAARSVERLRGWAGAARSLPNDFQSEARDFAPLAAWRAELSGRLAEADRTVARLRSVAADPAMAEQLRESQRREVDIALERVETDPLLEPLASQYSLGAGMVYQVRVHIGNRTPESLMTGEPAPIDPLLPDPEPGKGHRLEVVVQGKDFDVISDSTRPLQLPEFGGSEPVFFLVRAPVRIGPAELRVCVYHQNHLIQSFLLQGEVTDYEAWSDDPKRLGVRLEFTRTEKFAALDQLKPRQLSLGTNQGSKTHQLIVKGDQAAAELELHPGTFGPEVAKFRKTMERAALDPQNPQMPREFQPVAAGRPPDPDAAELIRQLARQGAELYEAVFRKASRGQLRKALVRIQRSQDEKLQIVRFDENFVFPWASLYDFLLPERRHGEPPPPVCLGRTADSAGRPAPCAHSPDDRVYCVNGFWGVRHFVEELIGAGSKTNTSVQRAQRDSIRLVADSSLTAAKTLADDLRNLAGDIRQLADGPADSAQLVDLLWKIPPQRPAVLVLLGHLETSPKPGEPDAPRVVLSSRQWLTRKNIADRALRDAQGWEQPQSVVLMMVCESAVTNVETVNDFVTAWDMAGAGAIVGTESFVGARLAAECAKELIGDLWTHKTLGEAMTRFRRTRLQQGNPQGFLFRALGDVDLTLN